MDLRDFTPEKLLKLNKSDPNQRKKYLRMVIALKIGFGLEKSMHSLNIDLSLEKVDLLWRAICEAVLDTPEWTVLDYAKKLRQDWGCDSCTIEPCDPKICRAADLLGEGILSKIEEDEPTLH